MKPYEKDAELLKQALASLPAVWDGKEATLELKRRDYHWRQMEWIGWYFEILCRDKLRGIFEIPGRKYGNVQFDCFRSVNWDMKSSAIKTDRHVAILNDIDAADAAISEYGGLGIVMALADVDYNDENRSFQKWHADLKGGESEYERDRIKRNATSRYRKTGAVLQQILLLFITEENREHLGIHAQGRNSNGLPRNPKYSLNIEKSDRFEIGRIDF